jgi:hypothetical protein
MKKLGFGLAVVFLLVGCGGGDGSIGGSGSPSTAPTSTWSEYDGGPVDPYDAGTKPPPVCTPLTVQCPSSQREVCSGDGQWATLSDLPMCSTVCEAPIWRFLVSVDDNTTTDTTTGLTWMWRAGQGTATCASYGTGYRLPTQAEIASLEPGGGCTPNMDQAAFADQNEFYNTQELPNPNPHPIVLFDASASSFGGSLPYGAEVYSRCVR